MPLLHTNVAALSLTNIALPSGGAAVLWEQSPGTAYTVQYQSSLEDGVWRVPLLLDYPVLSNRWDYSPTKRSEFYRVTAVPAPQRGELRSGTLRMTLGFTELNVLFALARIPLAPQYPAVLHKITYETVDPTGRPVIASGAVVLPLTPPGAVPVFVYQHGTILQPAAAPSAMDLRGEIVAGAAMASSGYATILPDYLGLGDSAGPHYYHHARSEATVAVDMLRAAQTYIAAQGVALSGKLFIAGYSQGGHAALALLRELEMLHAQEFVPTACAAMAGAYDLSGVTTADALSSRQQPNPYYFLYLLNSFQHVYGLATSLADLLAPPYDQTLPPLINGKADAEEINRAMPSSPVNILKAEYLEAFRSNVRHPLRLALADNDLHRWAPRTPVRLYHCTGDQDVVFANSQAALESFRAHGTAQVELIEPLAGGDHGTCVEPSMLHAKAWFDSLR
jgi:hypothetical protein